ncbi:hypothetical protein [Mucilaginibacter myungsuensis]|uniref:PKD domain-containing protein n=1 Tax=Mucilaginibacter myungsuensis TaxID=649104 RepID=A0A929KVY8_9SPHI|nr:hypothetical protein [Mucilaginibacter myungsuensis]MBE9662606.1 hypothetical protein [Mucilaginibacter myungsuensis]MDN3598026.1 hypothetical protein [Mucilaginibacter myungsuensis]
MKKLIFSVLALIAFCFIIQSCNKLNDPAIKTVGNIKLSNTEVMIGQPDTLYITNAAATDSIAWAVLPTGYNTIATKGQAAVLTFRKAGTYTVTAKVNNGAVQTATIVVNSQVYVAPGTSVPMEIINDDITLNPKLYKSATSDSTYIYMIANTKNKYCPAGRLNTNASVDANGNYSSNIINVLMYGNCPTGTEQLYATIKFNQGPAVLANGTYTIGVRLNDVTYTGTVVVTAATITFNWNHTSGVILSNKVIIR